MAYYIPRLYRFLEQLSRHNDRPWFEAHRSEYQELRDLWLADLQRLIDLMAAYEPGLAGTLAKKASYRIYRDTRFSHDKTPYKTFFSASMEPVRGSVPHAGYYLHVGLPGMYDTGLYGGIYSPDGPTLRKLRQAIVDNIEEFEDIIHDPELQCLCPGWVGPSLKTVPKGYDRDHPLAELLRLKSYGKFMHAGEEFFDDPMWPEKGADAFRMFKPLVDFLNYSIDE